MAILRTSRTSRPGRRPAQAARIAVSGADSGAEVVGVWGMRGSGKTTRARELVHDAARVVAFDPLDEWARFPGWTRAESLRELVAVFKRSWRRFRVAYVPAAGQLPAQLHGVAAVLWQAQAPFPACPGLVLVVDELDATFPAHRLPAQLDGMPTLVLRGRHRGVGVVGISQRPALVSLSFRGNCARQYVLQLAAQQDRAAVLALIGREHGRQLAELAPHDFLEAHAGMVRRGRNGRR